MTPKIIVLDPGHGGQDPGVTWQLVRWSDTSEYVEKHINLHMALLLRKALLDSGMPIAVEMTREEDEDISLHARGALAKKHAADLVISLHVNAHENAAYQGLMCFVRHRDAASAPIANVIARNAPAEMQRKHAVFECDPAHAWLNRARNVLERYECPAVLVEMLHLTNTGDREGYDREDVRAGIIAACVAGVASFVGAERAAGWMPLMA